MVCSVLEEHSQILSAREVEEQGKRRANWFAVMRSNCHASCNGVFASDLMQHELCLGGCDKFFEIIRE
jgi:hypothetical protein